MRPTPNLHSPIQERLFELKRDGNPSCGPFNCAFHFMETMIKLRLTGLMTGHSAMDMMSWRDISSYG